MERLNPNLEQKINEGWSQEFHFVEDAENELEIASLIAGFANSNDGVLVVGVKENGKVVGSFPKQVTEDFEHILSQFLSDQIKFTMEEVLFGRHLLTRFFIKKSLFKISVINNSSKETYLRIGFNTVPVNKIVLKAWALEHHSLTVEMDDLHREMLSYFHQNKSISLSNVYKVSKMKKSIIDKLISELLYLKQIHLVINNNRIEYLLR
ncbi:MAG TPA: ATP-binding protein [Crocinitomicaceae bacterium]|nr:ATP-binding protein [Crocinitomicaceae bacterium]